MVRAIRFQAGSAVRQGDVLVELDADVDRAQLQAARVDAHWAQVRLDRAKNLSKSHSISEADLDAANTSLQQAQAQVAYYEAVIAKKTIRAPFSGVLGIRNISVGQYLAKGSPLVSLQDLDAVLVEFSLPQQRLGDLQPGLTVEVTADAYPGQLFTGTLSAINPDIDPATRNVRVQARVPNPDHRLRPGMFVSLDLMLARTEQILMVPATAVAHSPYGDSVFVIEAGKAAEDGSRPQVLRQQFVRLGTRQGDFVEVTEGLQGGEQLVSTGVFKLQPGMSVEVDNSLAPRFSLDPRPRNT